MAIHSQNAIGCATSKKCAVVESWNTGRFDGVLAWSDRLIGAHAIAAARPRPRLSRKCVEVGDRPQQPRSAFGAALSPAAVSGLEHSRNSPPIPVSDRALRIVSAGTRSDLE